MYLLFGLTACGAPGSSTPAAADSPRAAKAIEVPNAPPRRHLFPVPDSLYRSVGVVAYDCHGERRSAAPGSRARIPVDLAFASPPEQVIRAVEAAGGKVLHRFNARMVRAELDTAAIGPLLQGPSGIGGSAYAVPDTVRRDVRLSVDLRATFREPEERAVRRLGGWVLGGPRNNHLEVIIPDSMVPRLRELRWVRQAEVSPILCGQATEGMDEAY